MFSLNIRRDGPTNSEVHQNGKCKTSIDPIHSFIISQILQWLERTCFACSGSSSSLGRGTWSSMFSLNIRRDGPTNSEVHQNGKCKTSIDPIHSFIISQILQWLERTCFACSGSSSSLGRGTWSSMFSLNIRRDGPIKSEIHQNGKCKTSIDPIHSFIISQILQWLERTCFACSGSSSSLGRGTWSSMFSLNIRRDGPIKSEIHQNGKCKTSIDPIHSFIISQILQWLERTCFACSGSSSSLGRGTWSSMFSLNIRRDGPIKSEIHQNGKCKTSIDPIHSFIISQILQWLERTCFACSGSSSSLGRGTWSSMFSLNIRRDGPIKSEIHQNGKCKTSIDPIHSFIISQILQWLERTCFACSGSSSSLGGAWQIKDTKYHARTYRTRSTKSVVVSQIICSLRHLWSACLADSSSSLGGAFRRNTHQHSQHIRKDSFWA